MRPSRLGYACGAANLLTLLGAAIVLATGAASPTATLGTTANATLRAGTPAAAKPPAAPAVVPTKVVSNGEAAKPAATIIADAKRALESASTVRFILIATEKGKSFRLDFTYVNKVGSRGTVAEGDSQATIVRIGNDFYFKGNGALLGGGAGAAAATDQFYRFSASGKVAMSLASFTTLDSVAEQVLGEADATKVDTESDGGADVVVLTSDDGSKLLVSATGAPLPLKVTGPANDPGSASFYDYNAKVTLTAPPDATPLPG